MARPDSRRRFLLVTGLVSVLLIAIGVVVVTQINDFVCSDPEQQAMAGFAHYGGITPDWESNAKVTGGCTTSYIVGAHPDEALAYYREQLAASGWTVTDTPANTFPPYFTASRGNLEYFLMFEGAGQGEDESGVEGGSLAPELGQTRVSILGGHRD